MLNDAQSNIYSKTGLKAQNYKQLLLPGVYYFVDGH